MPPATAQELVSRLAAFWSAHDCQSLPSFEGPIADPMLAPDFFLRLAGTEPARKSSLQIVRRPAHGRYGKNPLIKSRELYFHVLLKPAELAIEDLFLKSLKAAGFELDLRDVRLAAGDFALPAVGLTGTGWRASIDGIRSARMSYLLALGHRELALPSVEVVYAVERLALVQGTAIDSGGPESVARGEDVEREAQLTAEAFEVADGEVLWRELESCFHQSASCLRSSLTLPAYERALDALHWLGRLDARGLLTAGARDENEARCRHLAVEAASRGTLASGASEGVTTSAGNGDVSWTQAEPVLHPKPGSPDHETPFDE